MLLITTHKLYSDGTHLYSETEASTGRREGETLSIPSLAIRSRLKRSFVSIFLIVESLNLRGSRYEMCYC